MNITSLKLNMEVYDYIKYCIFDIIYHVDTCGERRTAFRVLCGILKERDHLEDSCVEGMTRLKLIL